MESHLNIDNSRSYATEANLVEALKKYHLADCRPLVVCNRAGRFTAVFSGATLSAMRVGIISAAQHGFMTI